LIKNADKIVEEKTEKISQIVKAYVDEMNLLSETDGFTIDNIEKMWEELDERAREVYREISQALIEQLDEKEIIRSKKANTRREG
jgi:uncharacterized protein YabN with tetrapyrrole methylase and pyrophosphatase domain